MQRSLDVHRVSTAAFQLPPLLARYQILSGAKIISEQNKAAVRDAHHDFARLVLTDAIKRPAKRL